MKKRNYFNMNDGGIMFFLFLIVSSLLATIVMAICRKNGLTAETNEYYSILSLAVNQIAMIVAFFGYSLIAKVNFVEATNIKKLPNFKQSLTLAGVAVSMILAFLPIAYLFLYLLSLAGYHGSSNIQLPSGVGGFFASLVFAVIMPAILEELIYRGCLLNGLKQKNYLFAVMITSLIFSLAHGSAYQTVHQFLASIVICLVVLYGGSVSFGILLHFFNNLISLIFEYVPIDFAPLGYFNILLGVACFIVGILMLTSFIKLFVQQCKDRQRGEKIINVYAKGKIVYVISTLFDSVCNFFRCIVNKEDRKNWREHFEESVGFLDEEYVRQESVFGKETHISLLIIGIIAVLAIMWIVALVQGFVV